MLRTKARRSPNGDQTGLELRAVPKVSGNAAGSCSSVAASQSWVWYCQSSFMPGLASIERTT